MGLKPNRLRPIFLQLLAFVAVGLGHLSRTYSPQLALVTLLLVIERLLSAEPGPKVRRECPTT